MHNLFDRIERALRCLAVGAALAMLAILAAQVVMRYVFNTPLSWSEETAMLLFTWVALLSTIIGIRRGSHARMSLLVDMLPQWAQAVWERLISLIILALGVFIAYSGWDYLDETRGSVSPAIGYPIEWLYASAPCFGALLVIFSLEQLIYGNRLNDE